MSQRRNNKSSDDIDNSNFEEAIKECVRFIVCREGSKIPIKRVDILKHLNSVCEVANKNINTIVIEANKILKNVYGYKLVQVKVDSGIQYITVLNENCDSQMSTAIDGNQRKLLVAALTNIYMSGGPVLEEHMWKFLEEANLLKEDDNAGRKLLTTTFTRQMYLKYSKVGKGDLAKCEFDWGQRAQEEIPKMFLLEKMAQAFGKEPRHWFEQYKAATESDNTE